MAVLKKKSRTFYWIHLAYDVVKSWVVVNTLMDLWLPAWNNPAPPELIFMNFDI
jgi:hypothetical protein